jgi:tetratricopeptide (TPR) repeat protein
MVLNNQGEEIDRIIGFGGKKDPYLQTIKDYAEGKNTLDQFIQTYQSDTLNIESNFSLAKKYLNRFERAKADKYLRNVLLLDPADENGFGEECLLNIAIYEVRSNNNVDKLLDFLTSSTNESFLAKGYHSLIQHYKEEQDTLKVIEFYEEAIDKITNNAEMMNAYAWDIYQAKKKDMYDRGIELAKKAVELEPDAAGIWDTLGWLYFETGDIENAVKAMQTAVELEPKTDYYRQNLQKFKSSI